jgi:hypothetical protein
MADEEKTKDFAEPESPVEEATEEVTETAPEEVPEPLVAPSCEAVQEKTPIDSPDEKRRRLVVGGLVAATILSLVAVLVAGIFQVTARWLIQCPQDLPVNDPSPVLWSEMISDKAVNQPLGIQDKLVEMTKFKTDSPPTRESVEGEKQNR